MKPRGSAVDAVVWPSVLSADIAKAASFSTVGPHWLNCHCQIQQYAKFSTIYIIDLIEAGVHIVIII